MHMDMDIRVHGACMHTHMHTHMVKTMHNMHMCMHMYWAVGF